MYLQVVACFMEIILSNSTPNLKLRLVMDEVSKKKKKRKVFRKF